MHKSSRLHFLENLVFTLRPKMTPGYHEVMNCLLQIATTSSVLGIEKSVVGYVTGDADLAILHSVRNKQGGVRYGIRPNGRKLLIKEYEAFSTALVKLAA